AASRRCCASPTSSGIGASASGCARNSGRRWPTRRCPRADPRTPKGTDPAPMVASVSTRLGSSATVPRPPASRRGAGSGSRASRLAQRLVGILEAACLLVGIRGGNLGQQLAALLVVEVTEVVYPGRREFDFAAFGQGRRHVEDQPS